MAERGPWIDHFPGNFLWSNATLVIKGMAPYGAVSLEEIDRACERLKTRQGEPNAWWEEWDALGACVEGAGNAAETEGHAMTAGNFFLRAGNYYYTAERFMAPGHDKRQMGEKAYGCWHAGLIRRYPQIEFVELPYLETTLPGLFIKGSANGAAPTVVIFNGMDNAKEMSVLFAGLEFARRGWNTLAVDGPGQGENLRLRGLHGRYDYEVPGSAAYEYVASRGEVDPDRVVIMGYSFGGYYSARIAAFEKRYAACVALTAPHWDLAGWQQRILDRAKRAPSSVGQSNFQFQWVVNAPSPEAAIDVAKKFSLVDVATEIECPLLVTHGGNDRIIPPENAPKLFEAAGSVSKQIRIFKIEEGGAEHAHVDNRQIGIDFAADWIASVV
jgi:pimeloyl-ACP methyl ester carboxylesterase